MAGDTQELSDWKGQRKKTSSVAGGVRMFMEVAFVPVLNDIPCFNQLQVTMIKYLRWFI